MLLVIIGFKKWTRYIKKLLNHTITKNIELQENPCVGDGNKAKVACMGMK